MRAISLGLRLALLGLVCITLALGVAFVGLSSLFNSHVERRAEAELTVHFDQLLGGLTVAGAGVTAGAPLSDPRFQRVYGGLYWQIDTADGQSRSRSLWDGVLETGKGTGPSFTRISGPQGEDLLARSQQIALPAALGGGAARVVVAMDAASIDAAGQEFIRDMLPYLLVLELVLIAAGVAQIYLGLRPLQALRTRVGHLRRGKAARMGAGWPSEVQPLAAEVDALLDQHEQEVRLAQHRASDLAHGLKTPLQALLGEAARLDASGQGQAARSINDLVARMRRQVDFELMRTRAQRGTSDLRKVAQGVLSVLARVPEAETLVLENTIPADLTVALPPEELAELLGAITENAVRHAAAEVLLQAKAVGDQIAITICDDGPGLPDDQRERLLSRGARLDESGEGSGLGLAIAQSIIARRGGRLDLSNRPGGGLSVRLTLPIRQSR
ncbi:two component sensor histidine kinase (plasmid) [Ketogulonicigenium vulgare Y25]|uniref:histidine kinase n=3 Tax=Ketogulonicigenium vulgare TaxID=92945 RepID=F9YB74_KETVW|nr:HAMP domain-containing sensor histidine kinase [Ketogulonicigenium vulgare]ADO44103.1 two component sensor histidine kinase [Ketogulonicigenium vulgare Y25]AEM42626.1 putative sensory transduction histidine kinase [Ketogulonicigenium vulgare WSH-001]ALJ82650.1 histidine kinase [Ketogulonicigenium vulgare]AOZ53328.1 two component sensor histidine kinase [Ketogulonicigenium vulgare]